VKPDQVEIDSAATARQPLPPDSTDVRASRPGRPPAVPAALGGDDPQLLIVIEDSPEYTQLTGQLLIEALGVEVEIKVCDTLDAAGRLLRECHPDCILLDLSRPGADGLEAVRTIQAIAAEVPVVVLGGRDDEALAVQAVQEGAQDYLVKRRADSHLLARSIRYAIERKRTELAIARQAFVDPLTGLPNRSRLIERLTQALARVERSDDRVAVLFIDLDRFKIINDSLGHEAGDEVLAIVAKRLCEAVRPADTVARFGGDEFVILCDDLDLGEDIAHIAERIGTTLSSPIELGERELTVDASIGIAIGAGRRIAPEELIRAADQAMFRAKQRGSSWELAEGTSGLAPSKRLDIQAELRRALERTEFQLHYQPQVELTSHRVAGVEALLRWDHPQRGLVPPAEFIPEAEESGLIVMIGEWVIAESCRQLASWRDARTCDEDLVMSVNLSARQLADRRLVEVVEDGLRRNGVRPDRLCLEITESTVAANSVLADRTLQAIKDLGARLAIDDFGTGQSSLAMLDHYPVDVLKVDRSFVAPLGNGLRPRRFFAAVVGVARALGLQVVAEGIERADQLRVAEEVGCDAVQGFWLARPAPAVAVGGSLRVPLAGA
jgi:diguanylate cyclase (GGDEF)-like protein